MDFLSQDNGSLSCLGLSLMRNSCQLKSREVSEELSRTKMSYEKYFLRACVERVRVRVREREKERESSHARAKGPRLYALMSHYYSMLNMMR